MTLSEFKAWFEGYTEDLEGAPSKAQFDRIKEKVKTIDGAPITYPIYVDRYVPTWPSYQPWPSFPYQPWRHADIAYAQGVGVSATDSMAVSIEGFDAHSAMYALGKAEARAA